MPKKRFLMVPISYYRVFVKKGVKEGEIFLIKKLGVYPNLKRRLLCFLLRKKFFSSLIFSTDYCSNADLIIEGSRRKEFYFKKKLVKTYCKDFSDCYVRLRMNKFLNCIKDPKKFEGFFSEVLIWPTFPLSVEDLLSLFARFVPLYKRYLKKRPLKKVVDERRKRLTTINPFEIISKGNVLSTFVHGDFWIGNLEKDSNGALWVFDWGQAGIGTLFEDFVHYFIIEYFFTRKINKNLFERVLKLFIDEFHLSPLEVKNLIGLEIGLNKINRPRKDWRILEKFRNEIQNFI